MRNLQIYPRTNAAAAAEPRGEPLQKLLDRADTSSSTLSVAPAMQGCGQAASAAAPLALRDGSAEEREVVPAGCVSAARDLASTIPDARATPPEGVEVPGGFVSGPAETVAEGQRPLEMPSSVADSVEKLARAHYGKELPTGSLPAGEKARVQALKKPASAASVCFKKPASQEEAGAQASLVPVISSKKRPAAAPKHSAKKRPAAAGPSTAAGSSSPSASASGFLKPLSEKRRFELQPKGCSSCRGRPGCCRSCWAKRGYLVK